MGIQASTPLMGDYVSTTAPLLIWHHGSGINLPHRYAVFLGTQPDSHYKIASDQLQDSFALNGLKFNETYYWKIVAGYQ
jgi:hypothetical protein